MGTLCDIQLYASAQDQADHTARAVIADVDRLEALYSRYRDDSLLSRINQVAAEGGSITVDAETQGLLDYAQTCYQESGGLFDITSGILRRAWDFKSGCLPGAGAIERLLPKIGWHKLNWTSPELSFPVPGMEIDLGGVVKEYAADRAATLCREFSIQHGLINLGGDVRVIGPHPDGSPWKISIRHPQKAESALKTVELFNGALASSGDYERCITIDGRRYGHVLNPLTGWPVKSLAAVSVISEHCVTAGSAATIAMLKEEEGKSWLKKLGLPHLWMDVDGSVGGSY